MSPDSQLLDSWQIMCFRTVWKRHFSVHGIGLCILLDTAEMTVLFLSFRLASVLRKFSVLRALSFKTQLQNSCKTTQCCLSRSMPRKQNTELCIHKKSLFEPQVAQHLKIGALPFELLLLETWSMFKN